MTRCLISRPLSRPRRANTASRFDQMSLALSPPVTSYSAPVTMAAASEARNTAAGETSSGCSQPTLSATVGALTSQACCGVGSPVGFCPVSLCGHDGA